MEDKDKGGKCPADAPYAVGGHRGHTGHGPGGGCSVCIAGAAFFAPLGPYSDDKSGRTVRATAAALRRGELHLYAVVAFLGDGGPSFSVQSAAARACTPCRGTARMVLPSAPSYDADSTGSYALDAPGAVHRLKNWHESESEPLLRRAPAGLISFVLDVVEGLDIVEPVHHDTTGLGGGFAEKEPAAEEKPRASTAHIHIGRRGAADEHEIVVTRYAQGDVDLSWWGPEGLKPGNFGRKHWWAAENGTANGEAHFDNYAEAFARLEAWLGPLFELGGALDEWETYLSRGGCHSWEARYLRFDYMGSTALARLREGHDFDPYKFHRLQVTDAGVEPNIPVIAYLESLPGWGAQVVEIQDPASLAELMCADEPTFGQRMTGTDKCPVCGQVGCVYWEHWK